jgi:hypothetical protein
MQPGLVLQHPQKQFVKICVARLVSEQQGSRTGRLSAARASPAPSDPISAFRMGSSAAAIAAMLLPSGLSRTQLAGRSRCAIGRRPWAKERAHELAEGEQPAPVLVIGDVRGEDQANCSRCKGQPGLGGRGVGLADC